MAFVANADDSPKKSSLDTVSLVLAGVLWALTKIMAALSVLAFFFGLIFANDSGHIALSTFAFVLLAAASPTIAMALISLLATYLNHKQRYWASIAVALPVVVIVGGLLLIYVLPMFVHL